MAVWQFAATACVCYLHHDGHPQGVFSYVVFALLARSAATFGVFCPVQLVGVSVRHDSPVMEKDCVNPWVAMTLLLVSAAVVTATEINARPEITEAKPACACAHTAAANVARGLTLSGFFFFQTSLNHLNYNADERLSSHICYIAATCRQIFTPRQHKNKGSSLCFYVGVAGGLQERKGEECQLW